MPCLESQILFFNDMVIEQGATIVCPFCAYMPHGVGDDEKFWPISILLH